MREPPKGTSRQGARESTERPNRPSSNPTDPVRQDGAARLVVYPVVIAILPILWMYSDNVDSVPVTDLTRPVLVLTIGTAVAWLGFLLSARCAHRAGVLTAIGAVVFWTAMPFAEAVCSVPLSAAWHTPWPAVLTWSALYVAVVAVILHRGWEARGLTRAFNWFALTVGAVPAVLASYQLLLSSIPYRERTAMVGADHQEPRNGLAERTDDLPDVYFIVVDAYARADVLERVYGIAGGLAESLAALGFYVADESTANYSTTFHSVPSALNLDYIQGLLPEASRRTHVRTLSRLTCDNAVVRALRPFGYKFVAYASGYFWTECPAADVYMRPPHVLSEFETAVLNRSPFRLLVEHVSALNAYHLHRERILDLFDSLPALAEDSASTFVFAHLVTPHHPFVFGANGEDVSPYGREFRFDDRGGAGLDAPKGQRSPRYVASYGAQVRYVSKRLSSTLAELLRRSTRPPVIIVQGDHGPNSINGPSEPHERFPILNAYFLPDGGHQQLYESITPVNSFRVVMNRYFGARYELLPDKNYRASYQDPFRFRDVTVQAHLHQAANPIAAAGAHRR